MSRKPHQPAELGDAVGPIPEGHAITVAEEQEARDIESGMAFEAARLLGQIEASQFSARCAQKVVVEVYLKLKQNKAYKAIHIKDEAGNARRCAHLDEFCEHFLGKSSRSVQELVANYHVLGADLFEQAEQLGFKRNDYRALKALPADDQAAIKAAMQSDDRDQILDLMQELAARHASEKAALTAEATEAKETAAARDEVIASKEATISRLELRATSAERRQANFTDIEAAGYECAPLHQTVAETIVALKKMEREVAHLMEEVGGDIVLEECVTAVLVAARRAVEINRQYRLGIPDATMLDIIEEDERQAIEFRALGLAQQGAVQ